MPVKSLAVDQVGTFETRFACPYCGSWPGSPCPPQTRVKTRNVISYLSGARNIDNPCSHTKLTQNLNYSYGGAYIEEYHTHNKVKYHCYCASASGPAYAPVGYAEPKGFGESFSPALGDAFDSFAERAYSAMRPTMTTSAGLSNFIIELREFKDLFKVFSRHKSLLTNAANANLNYQFGWRPFINDIRKMVKGIGAFESRLAKFIQSAGWQQVRRYSHALEVPSYTTDWVISGPHKTRTIVTVSEAKASCKLTYQYNLPSYSYSELRVRALLDTLGLNLNPSTIWNAIPWSWLVDWFVNAGDFVKRFDTAYIEPDLQIMACLYSIKTRGSAVQEFIPWYAQGNSPVTAASCEFTNYSRFFGSPKTNKEIDLNLPTSAGKVSILASLYLTRR